MVEERQILATIPVVSVKPCGPLALQKEFPHKKAVETGRVFIKNERAQCVKSDALVDSKEKSGLVVVGVILWQDISSGLPLAHHFTLSGSESIFGLAQDPPICAHA